MIDQATFDQLSRGIDSSANSLYEALGIQLLGDGMKSGPADPERPRKFGKAWFNRHRAVLQRLLCDNEAVRVIMNDPKSDRAVQAAAIWEVVSASDTFSSTTIVTSLLVLRLGLVELCGE